MSLEKNLYDSAVLTKAWQRDEVVKPSLPQNNSKADMYCYSRTSHIDATIMPPIRQTASIFKQPVTLIKNHKGIVKESKQAPPSPKPKQLFWVKRLENMRVCDTDGYELRLMDLPMGLKAVGPHISQKTLVHSVATALHVSPYRPITGQTGSRSALEKNSGVYLNPDQPLIQAVAICDEDIKKQEDRVNNVRKRLQEAVKCII